MIEGGFMEEVTSKQRPTKEGSQAIIGKDSRKRCWYKCLFTWVSKLYFLWLWNRYNLLNEIVIKVQCTTYLKYLAPSLAPGKVFFNITEDISTKEKFILTSVVLVLTGERLAFYSHLAEWKGFGKQITGDVSSLSVPISPSSFLFRSLATLHYKNTNIFFPLICKLYKGSALL